MESTRSGESDFSCDGANRAEDLNNSGDTVKGCEYVENLLSFVNRPTSVGMVAFRAGIPLSHSVSEARHNA